MEEVNRISAEKNRALVGQVVEVLSEGKSKTNKALYTGRTGGHKLVNFKADEDVTGRMVKVHYGSVNLQPDRPGGMKTGI